MDITNINLFYLIENSFNQYKEEEENRYTLSININNEIMTLLFIGECLHIKYNFEISIKQNKLYSWFSAYLDIYNYNMYEINKRMNSIRISVENLTSSDNDLNKYSILNTKKLKIE